MCPNLPLSDTINTSDKVISRTLVYNALFPGQVVGSLEIGNLVSGQRRPAFRIVHCQFSLGLLNTCLLWNRNCSKVLPLCALLRQAGKGLFTISMED